MKNTLHPELERTILDMIEAIKEAIADANRSKTRYTAVRGQHHTSGAGGSYYTFLLEDDWEPGPNISVLIEIDPDDPERTIPGTILSTLNAHITLVTETPLPQAALAEITLFEATVWLLEKLRTAVIALRERGETPAQMAAKTFGLLPSYEGTGQRKARITGFTPDPDQERAIVLGMESERLFLIGPPGTGKTSVESALAIEYLLADKTVLIAAYTNVALDNAMQRLKQYCEESGNGYLVREHRIVRVGRTKDLTGDAYRDITLQGIVDQYLGQLAQERARLQQEQSDLEESIARLSHNLLPMKEEWVERRGGFAARIADARRESEPLEARERQRLSDIAQRLETLLGKRRVFQEKKQAAERAAQAWEAALPAYMQAQHALQQALDSKIRELTSLHFSSTTSRLVSRLRGVTEQSLDAEVQQRRAELNEALRLVKVHEQQRDAALLASRQAQAHITALEQEERQLRSAQQLVTPTAKRLGTLKAQIAEDEQAMSQGDAEIAEAEQEGARMQRSYQQALARLKEIEGEQRAITSRVVAEARLIGATLTGLTISPYLRGRLFHASIVDEASMASLVLTLLAVALATRHAAIIGDPYQLAPIIKLQDKKRARWAAYWLGTELYSHLRLTLEDADAGKNQVVLLTQQSRMLPQIAAPVSHYIYGGRLKDRVDPQRVPHQLAPHREWPLMLVDTGDVDRGKGAGEEKVSRARRPPRSSSKYNLYHVECVVRVVQLLLPQLADLASNDPQIAVITPYSAQRIRIQHALRERGLLDRVHVGTVHGYQSKEYLCIICDTTEGYGVPIRQFTSNQWGHGGIAHGATRLINVAHSRARDKLIYIANVDYIRQEPYRKGHLLTQIVNSVYEHGHIDSSELFRE
jgi:AAA domain